MRLDELATVSTGIVAARKQAKSSDAEILKYRILNLKAVRGDGDIESSLLEDFEAKEKIKSKYLAQVGDIVVRLTAPFTAILISETYKDIMIPSHFAIIRVDAERLLPEYLYWLLNTDELRQMIGQNINSTTIGTVKPMVYASLDIDLITLEQQKKIGELYKLVKKEQNLLEKIKEQKKMYYMGVLDRIQKEMRRENDNEK